MALPETNSSVGHSFGLEVDGVVIKQISEVTGLKMEQDTVMLKQNTHDGKYSCSIQPGRPKPSDVTLTRGLTEDQSFEKWIKDSRLGKMSAVRKGGAIIVYDFEGAPIKRYTFTNAWPKSLEIGSMKAGDASVLTEKVVLSCEMLEVA